MKRRHMKRILRILFLLATFAPVTGFTCETHPSGVESFDPSLQEDRGDVLEEVRRQFTDRNFDPGDLRGLRRIYLDNASRWRENDHSVPEG